MVNKIMRTNYIIDFLLSLVNLSNIVPGTDYKYCLWLLAVVGLPKMSLSSIFDN